MSSSVFERTRALHADVEDLKDKLLDATNKYANTVRRCAENGDERIGMRMRSMGRSAHCCRCGLCCLLLSAQSKDRILLDHELKQQLDELLACQGKLLEMYEDGDGSGTQRAHSAVDERVAGLLTLPVLVV